MPDNIKTDLAGYLLGEAPAAVETIVVSPEAPVAPVGLTPPVAAIPPAPAFPDAEMADLMAYLKCIGMCAKDMHYRCKGKAFYGLHQLGDLTWQLADETDKIAEIYFMGERGINPPRMKEVCANAVGIEVMYPSDDKYFIGGLMNICLQTMHKIEAIKNNYPDLKSGTVAVLDQISQNCLLNIGLLDQTMKGN